MKRAKGYPRTQFTVDNRTSVQEIPTSQATGTIPVYMATYTSDKGIEDWELLTMFEKFTDRKGPLSFSKHGQAQLLVANCLSKGAYVYAKRMVSPDAKLANATVKARVIVSNNVSYVYLYSVSAENVDTLKKACEAGYGDFDLNKEPTTTTAGDDSNAKSYDIPLFTVAALGRGASSTQFIIRPNYANKTTEYVKYSFEVIENSNVLESIMVTLNPDVIIDGVNQSIQNKLSKNSNQVNAKIYEDGFALLAKVLVANATVDGNKVSINDFVNLDFINGLYKSGKNNIGGVVCKCTDGEPKTLWDSFKPSDIQTTYSFDESTEEYIPLAGGSFGKLGQSPMNNKEEYTKLLMGVFGKADTKSEYAKLFDPVIYNVDGYKLDAIFDCNYPVEVKNAITDFVDFRQDLVFIEDLGTDVNTIDSAIEKAETLTQSKYCAIYGNYFNIVDPYTKKDITVTMPYLLADRLIGHISSGIGKPFAGINNNLSFPEIDVASINFVPVEVPGLDQKQQLVDANINYLGIYDNVPVMETLYVNDSEYTQLSFLNNILAIQEVIKVVRTKCPRIRYIFLDGGNDLQKYIDDVTDVINQYATNFKSIKVEYAKDELYESNNIFYAVITVQFYNFVQEEKFKIIAIN